MASVEGKLSSHQRFTMRDVHRSELKSAAYNPRVITEKAAKKLRENLRRVGLVQPIIWNERTGNIVGGHQRITALDALHKTSDYRLTVAVVDFDEKTEKEQNIFLNNAGAMGDFDVAKLDAMLKEGIDAELSGFSLDEMYHMFGEFRNEGAESVVKMSELTSKAQEAYKALANKPSTQDTDYYNVVVFASYEERTEFLKEFGLADNRYIDGRHLREMLRGFKKTEPSSERGKREAARPRKNKSEAAHKPA